MAVIVFGPMVTAIRGTIAGTTFSANKSGAYAKRWTAAPFSRTIHQNSTRGALSVAAHAWSATTPAQRTAWDAFATNPPETVLDRFGQPTALSGLQWFVRINTRRLAASGSLAHNPPIDNPLLAPTVAELRVRSFGSLSYLSHVVLSDDYDDPPAYAAISLALYPRAGAQVAGRGFKQLRIAAVPPSREISFGSALEERFGAYLDGWRAFVSVAYQSASGIRSASATANALIPSALEYGPELVSNGTFETAWAGVAPTYWTVVAALSIAASQDTTDPYSGSACARIQPGGGGQNFGTLFTNSMAAVPGRLYRLRFALKCTTQRLELVQIRFDTGPDALLFTDLQPSSWTEYEQTFTVPSDVSSMQVRLQFRTASSVDARLDNVSVQEII